MLRLIILAASGLSLSACAANVPQPVTNSQNPLTTGNVTLNLQKGVTTQADVLTVFGAPNIATVDASGQDVWSYQRHATVSQANAGSNYWTVILGGGSGSSSSLESTQRTMTLIIKFDQNDVVSDFRSRSSEF